MPPNQSKDVPCGNVDGYTSLNSVNVCKEIIKKYKLCYEKLSTDRQAWKRSVRD
jgi:hypothetical protein